MNRLQRIQLITITIIVSMQLEERKRKRRCEFDCKDHIFNVQTLKASCSKYDIRVQFCPKFQRDPLPPDHTFPQYNNDGKYFTSAFILGVDRRILVKNEQQELMDHQKQIRDSLEKHNQLVSVSQHRCFLGPTPSIPSALSVRNTTAITTITSAQKNIEKGSVSVPITTTSTISATSIALSGTAARKRRTRKQKEWLPKKKRGDNAWLRQNQISSTQTLSSTAKEEKNQKGTTKTEILSLDRNMQADVLPLGPSPITMTLSQ